jgi:septum formation protein
MCHKAAVSFIEISHVVILASGSPRRKDLLSGLGLKVEVRPPVGVDETPQPEEAPGAYVERLAREKNRSIASDGAVVVSADTAVVCGGEILGKPRDETDARRILNLLSGRNHRVLTGICVRQNRALKSRVVQTEVTFRTLGGAELDAYLATDEPWDKAGAYAIQGRAGSFVDHIQGSYTNVIGLPLGECLAMIGEVAGLQDAES